MKHKINQMIIIFTLIISLLALMVFATAFNFSISVNPASGSVVQGNSINTQVTVNLLHNPVRTVTLSSSGCPPSATCSFLPLSGNPTYTSTFNIATSASTPAGTYSITVTGTGDGKTRSITYILSVNSPPPAFDFSVSVNPASDSVVQGSSVSTITTVALLNGTSQPVSLTSTGCPPSATCSFLPLSGNPTYTSTFNIATSASTPAVTYPIIIRGTGGGLTRTTQYTLTVTAQPCSHNNPFVYVNPRSQSAPAGTALLYTAQVTNLDSISCASSTFDMTSVIPAGWFASYNPSSLIINPGSSQYTNFSITSPTGITPGNYTFINTATNRDIPSFSGSGSAGYVVN